jgi:hypothetical protein
MSQLNTLSRASNVYYLTPTTPAPSRAPKLSRRLVLRLRLLTFWWRLKLTAAETWDALRRFGRAPVRDTDAAFLEQRADLILAASPRALGPARIIDFDAARVRLRG